MAACTICRSNRRAELESALSTGTLSVRAAAREFGVSRDALMRHIRAHIDIADREAFAEVTGASALDLAESLLDVAQFAYEMRADASERGDDRTALAANKMYGSAKVALADRLGVTRPEVMRQLNDAQAITNAMFAAASEHPGLGELVSIKLEAHGELGLARGLLAKSKAFHAALGPADDTEIVTDPTDDIETEETPGS